MAAVVSASSEVPAYGLAGCLVAGVLLAGIAVWLWLRVRRLPGAASRAVVGALAGTAALFVGAFTAGQLHYGGTTTIAKGVTAPTCATWWEEIGQPADRAGLQGDFNSGCRHDAVAAIGPAVGYSALIGLGVAGLVFAALHVGWRRRQQRAARAARPVERFVE